VRTNSYGESQKLNFLDHFGELLSKRSFTRLLKKNKNSERSMLDVGCGFNARLTAGIRGQFSTCYLADISINPKLETLNYPGLKFLEGPIEETLKSLPDQSIDFIVANNIIEHLNNPDSVIEELRRIISSKGLIYINGPSWRGKYFLEFAAFRLGLAPVEEMQDHKNYYSKYELWTLVRRSNFTPRSISVFSKKFGLNSTAVINMSKN
jgi:ubiquinone/menaquinone biosynthesis C-methylase UbiE